YFFLIPLPPPISTLFPYTTLFRSAFSQVPDQRSRGENAQPLPSGEGLGSCSVARQSVTDRDRYAVRGGGVARRIPRCRGQRVRADRKSTRLNSSHLVISYAVFCLK